MSRSAPIRTGRARRSEEIKTWPKWAQTITDKVGLDTVKFWHPTGWVNQNWLTHVIFYWLTHLSPFADDKDWSFNTLVYWKFAIYILTVICVYYTGRVLGVNPALSAIFACASMFIGRSFLDIRPAGFSNLLVAVFILTLVLATYRNHLYIWLLVPATVFWANVHGGYVYVFMMLAPLVVLRLLTMLSRRATVSLYSILTWLAFIWRCISTPVTSRSRRFAAAGQDCWFCCSAYSGQYRAVADQVGKGAAFLRLSYCCRRASCFLPCLPGFSQTAGPNFSPEAAIYVEQQPDVRFSWLLLPLSVLGL